MNPDTGPMVYEHSSVPMRDGTSLSAVLFRPVEGTAPALVVRSPYGVKDTPMGGAGGVLPNVFSLVNNGYAVVWVECRGTFTSEGVFTPKVDEMNDGYDSIDWVTSQPWSNGRIGTYGTSYLGMTQWAVAITGHHALKAIAPSMTSMDFYKGVWYHPGGALSPAITVGWAIAMQLNKSMRVLLDETPAGPSIGALTEGVLGGLEVTEHTPVVDHPLIPSNGSFANLIKHSTFDSFWEQQDFGRDVHKIVAPALMITGWYDMFIGEQLRDFQSIRAGAGSPEAREGSRLIVGPWDHNDRTLDARYPDRDFGLSATGAAAALTAEHQHHFDRWLMAKPEAIAKPRAPVKLFIMGIDEWREEAEWPPPDVHYTPYFLDCGDGTLSTSEPEATCARSYFYDPRDPVRSTESARPGAVYEPHDLGVVTARSDVLTFRTPPLRDPLEVVGPITASLVVRTDARDTDFTARLVDEFPDGRAITLCDGIVRLRHRNGPSRVDLVEPGATCEVTVDLAATANVFLRGHRVRVDISSSNFPRFERNTNTGGAINSEPLDEAVVARNTLVSGPDGRTCVVLPLLERGIGDGVFAEDSIAVSR